MYADDHGRQIMYRLSADRQPGPVTVASPEGRFRRAKARLSAAQQGRMEAGIEFLAARTALHDWLEEIWPGQEGEESAAESAYYPAARVGGEVEDPPVRPGGRREGQHRTLTFEPRPARIGSEENE